MTESLGGSEGIDFPPGACTSDPTLTGKANFGFVSKYQRGASIPTGETEFRLRVADLDLHSTSYQWLVVAGARAMFKGEGEINGTGSYGFMVLAIDGALPGGGGAFVGLFPPAVAPGSSRSGFVPGPDRSRSLRRGHLLDG